IGPDFNFHLSKSLDLSAIERSIGLCCHLQPVFLSGKIVAVIGTSAGFPQLIKRLEIHIEHFRHTPEFFRRGAASQNLTVIENYGTDIGGTTTTLVGHLTLLHSLIFSSCVVFRPMNYRG